MMEIRTEFNIGDDVLYGITAQTAKQATIVKIIVLAEENITQIQYNIYVPAAGKVLLGIAECLLMKRDNENLH